jgi:hypothetical protein
MATFKSPEVIVNRSAEYFFNKIGDLNNLKDIMPSSIKDFESTATTCSFKMKGMPALNLELSEKIPFSKILLTAKGSQVPFSLDCFITEKGDQCQARLEINAELNMMMKMMVEKPLTQFLDVLAAKMEQF